MISDTRQQLEEHLLDELVEEICRRLQAGQEPGIDELSGEYPEMADRLRKLLPTLQAMAEFDSSATGSAIYEGGHALEKGATKTLGDFRILRLIGRGGMGVVYEAQQLSIDRRVALKILPLAALIDERALQRFKNEVTAIAALEHPNIVSIYAVGEERGIHYYAMKLVRGQSLAAVICELRARAERSESITGEALSDVVSDMEEQSSVSPSEAEPGDERTSTALSEPALDETRAAAASNTRGQPSTQSRIADQAFFRNALHLVLQAAKALEHAHDHGVVHRDIKPGNLLLDKQGNLFVTDFGLARVEAGAGVTLTGDVLGTLRYMSPEQVLANQVVVDHRTDVYSLGVTLYELLTLQPMWSSDDRPGLIRQISFEDPTRPGKINSFIPADLETIVLKAIEKNPVDRYQTAAEFADDVVCFLDNRPIVAKRPTTLQRMAKWTRRNPSAMWAAVVGMALLTLASLISSNLVLSANRKTEAALAQSENSLSEARGVVSDYLTRVSEEQLLDAPGFQHLRQDLLQMALAYYQRLTEQTSDGVLQKDLAEAHSNVGSILRQLGSPTEAIQSHLAALQIWRELASSEQDDGSCFVECVNELNAIGQLEAQLGKTIEAASRHDRAVQVARESLVQFPNSPASQFAKSTSLHYLAMQLRSLGNYDRGLELLMEAMDAQRYLVQRFPQNVEYRLRLASQFDTLAAYYNERKRGDPALAARRSAVEIREELFARHSDVIRVRNALAASYHNLSLQYKSAGREEEAEKSEGLALLHLTALANQNPLVVEFQTRLASCHNSLSNYQFTTGRVSDALESNGEAIDVHRTMVHQWPEVIEYRVRLADDYTTRAKILNDTGELPGALDCVSRAVSLRREVVEKDPDTASHRMMLAKAVQELAFHQQNSDLTDEAIESVKNSVDILTQLHKEHLDAPRYLLNLANAYRMLGYLHKEKGAIDDAIDAGEKGLAMRRDFQQHNPGDPGIKYAIANSLNNLSFFYRMARDAEAANRMIEEAIVLLEELVRKNPGNLRNRGTLANCFVQSAFCNWELGRPDAGLLAIQKALTQYEILCQRNPKNRNYARQSANCHIQQSDLLRTLGEEGLAVGHLETAVDLLTQSDDAQRPASDWGVLAIALYRLGDYRKAQNAAANSIAMNDDPGPDGGVARWWILTLSEARLGNVTEARKYFATLVESPKIEGAFNLRQYRDAAAELLGSLNEEAANKR